VNEKLLGDFIRKHNVRDKIFRKWCYPSLRVKPMGLLTVGRVVASKCGFACFEDGAVTNSPEHIKSYIEGTIERLGFTPDLYYLHRIDPSKSPTLSPSHARIDQQY
jgi:hypothetical protein